MTSISALPPGLILVVGGMILPLVSASVRHFLLLLLP